VRFVGTHFDHTSEVERLNQAKQLSQFLSGDDLPSLLAGDLNALPESETMRFLFRDWTPSSVNFEPTIPSTSPKSKIDYILYRPEYRWRVIESRVIDERIASDHNPVFTVLELLPD
jgi:endonuclease/exonuclease/phosphatase family metal-dependent hydrolase